MQESLYLGLDPTVAQPIVEFFSKFRLVHYRKGEIIARSDNSTHQTYCTKDGFLLSYTLTAEGHRNIRSLSRSNTVFPISDIVIPTLTTRYMPARTVFYESISDITIWQAPETDFAEFVTGNPEAQLGLFKHSYLNHRVHMSRLETLQMRNPQLRIASLLLLLASLFGTPRGHRIQIEAPISHQLIADSLSVARETASRELQHLKAMNMITYEGRYLIIPNVERIKLLLEES